MSAARPKMSPADMQKRMSARLSQSNPVSAPITTAMRSIIRLSIKDVDFYDRNPRTAANEKLAEIMASIEARGLDNMITVTKRPDTQRYTVSKGGNTRLLALNMLFEKTSDPKYLEQDFEVIPYTSEFELLIAHVSENKNRSDLVFWDEARSLMNLKEDLEREQGQPVSFRALAGTLKDHGVSVSPPFLTDAKWAVDKLSELGPAAIALKHQHVQQFLKPTCAKLEKLGSKLSLNESQLAGQVLKPAIEMARIRFEEKAVFEVAELVDALYSRFGSLLELTRLDVNRLLAVSEQNPDMEGQALLAAARQPAQQSLTPDQDLAETSERYDTPPPVDDPSDPQSVQSGDSQSSPEAPAALNSNDSKPQARPRDALRIVSGPPAGAQSTRSAGSTGTAASSSEPRDAADAGQSSPSEAHAPETSESNNASGPLQGLLKTVAAFANACGIGECVRSTDALPLGFMVEPPVLEPGSPALDTQAAEGGQLHRYYGWWWLVLLSMQNTPAGLAVVPEGRFATLAASEETWEQACDSELGEPVYADRLYKIVATMMDPADALGPLYLDVISAIRDIRQACPDRFTGDFWTARGVDPRLVEEL